VLLLFFVTMGCASDSGMFSDLRELEHKNLLLREELVLEKVKVDKLRAEAEMASVSAKALPAVSYAADSVAHRLCLRKPPPLVLFAEGYGAMKDERFRALEIFKVFVRLYPRHPLADDALYFMSDILVRDGERDDAYDLLEKICRDYPDGDRVSQALIEMGLILVHKGMIKEGEAKVSQAMEMVPYSMGYREGMHFFLKRGD